MQHGTSVRTSAGRRGGNLLSLSAAGFAGALAIAAAFPGAAGAGTLHDLFAPADRPSLNFYGAPGLVDMPTATPLPDGQVAVTVSHFGGMTRSTATFQALPRVSASFRYIGIRDWDSSGFETYRDRSFDLRFLVMKEGRRTPAVSIGLQDFAGTGIYAGEYVVASKSFAAPAGLPGRVTLSGGLGWGRLGSAGSIGTPFGGDRPQFDPETNRGGSPSSDQWFRGPAAPFAGVEWQVNDRWGLKAEYSSDAYEPETARGVFERRSRLNFGAEYRLSDRWRLGGYYLYGSEIGVNLQMQINPRVPLTPLALPPTVPVYQRPAPTEDGAVWQTGWTQNVALQKNLRDRLASGLRAEGLILVALKLEPHAAELRFSNDRYGAAAVAIGRAARVMAATLPPSVETLRLVPVADNLAQSTVILRRSDLEALEYAPQAADGLLAVTGFTAASPRLDDALGNPALYPDFAWSIGPYAAPSYFDPDEPVRLDVGAELAASYRPAPGWTLAGRLRHRLLGNVGDSPRTSNSRLPRVRTDAVLYAREADTALEALYLSKQWKLSQNVYARASTGYFERMFGGVSGEVLWKPVSSRLALGVEANFVRKRDFDGGFGFQDYDVATGHGSLYYEFDNGYLAQVDVGQYLAGDRGATFRLSREFENGWRVGGFFTLTDVSSEDFGEGSFDKGLTVEIPVSWFTGKPTPRRVGTTLRPIQRDGGARLIVPGRLYEQVRAGHRRAIEDQWSRVWQ